MSALFLTSIALFASSAPAALAAGPEKPTTEAAELINATTVKLKGALNPGAPAAAGETYEFLYKVSANECENEASSGTTSAAGAQGEAVSVEVGVQPSATYSFCLLARNEAGETAISSFSNFTTAAAPPAIDFEGSGPVNGTAATLTAAINPNNQSTKYTFEYSTKATGETLEGTITKVVGLTPLTGFGDQTAETRAEGLLPQTPYFWRVVATNASSETTNGKVETFTTPLPPEVPTIEPVVLEGLTAKLKGTLNPNNAPEVNSSYEFPFRLSPTECEGESSTGGVAEAGLQPEPVVAEAALQPNETYSFCLLARNQVGETVHSSVQTLTTPPSPPQVANEASSAVTSIGATLSAGINPNNQETNYTFEYAPGVAGQIPLVLPAPVTINSTTPLTGFGEQPVTVNTGALQPRTTYDYRVVATNATAEKGEGEIKEFTTLDGPVVVTGASQAITRTTAAISGTVSPGGLSTRYQFDYVECAQGQTCAYGESAKTTPSEVLGATDYATYPVGPQGLEELKPGTTYQYALVASNSEGERVGANHTFTTSPPAPPSASTGAASGVTQTSATISGNADTHGLPGTLSFEVGLSTEGGSLEPASVAGSQEGTSVEVTFSFGPYLQPGTVYYYRTVATNADGTATGEWRSFTTGSFPSPFAAPTTAIPLLSYTTVAEIEAREAKDNKPATTGKVLTNKQKLAKALKACHKSKSSAKRTMCERTAHSKYGPKKHKK